MRTLTTVAVLHQDKCEVVMLKRQVHGGSISTEDVLFDHLSNALVELVEQQTGIDLATPAWYS